MNTAELQAIAQDKARYDSVRDAMRTIIDATNTMGKEHLVAKAIAEELQSSHRTLQSCYMRCTRDAMAVYAKSRTDLRNQGAVDLAKVIAEAEVYLPLV